MKTILKKIGCIALTSVALLATSCSEDESPTTEFQFSAEDSTRAAQADNTIEGTLAIMENGYAEAEEGRSSINSFFPDCATVQFTPNGDGGTIVLDFGDGCELNNGSIVTGMITLEYGAFIAGTRTIEYTFQDFTYNQNGVSGGGTILREIANDNDNPQSTVNESITVSFPNTEITATRDGLRIAEWIEGVGSGTWTDNVYSITGNWETTFTNGFQRNGEVTEALIRELSCLYLVSGVLEIEQQNITAQLDFGDGSCDNIAVIIFNGETIPIILGN
ncbi:hypothetical protein [Candidatus Ulvibacter alkanivorans]|uniref:hypothetical protein n=1 Tax=Candidatus Ulvibacter alkanivorans TaxID=2267620 RepID=UPI000DF1ACBD|nr:hypothetical protein [Candidatus Ulvibacter alkanivorans]